MWLNGVFLYGGVTALEEGTKISGVDFFNELVWYIMALMGYKDVCYLSWMLFKCLFMFLSEVCHYLFGSLGIVS